MTPSSSAQPESRAHVPRAVIAAQLLAGAGVVVAAALDVGVTHWHPVLAVALLVFAVVSDFAGVQVSDAKISVSGSFVALVLSMVLLGPTPAAIIGAVSALVAGLRIREPRAALRHNVVVFAIYPFAGALAFQGAGHALGVSAGTGGYYFLALASYLVALFLNFGLIASYATVLRRTTMRAAFHEALLPLLPSEIVTALLTVSILFLYRHAGVPAILLVATAIIAMQFLLAQLLAARRAATELEKRTGELHEQARTDELTGLGNRRRLLDDLAAVLAVIDTTAVSLTLFDLDGFKGYNDAFGHLRGDELLRRLGRRLSAAVEPLGAAYRLGGDEFCVLSRGPEGQDALLALSDAALRDSGPGFFITSSYGTAYLPAEARGASEALRLADQRMYAQKANRPASAKRQARDLIMGILAEQQPSLHEHVVDVARLAVDIARDLGVPEEQLDDVGRAAELHDVGKIAVPEALLTKAGPLDEEEWDLMRQHTVVGERMLAAAPALRGVARLVRSSHERWDGGGYPDGLSGEEIPLGARIIAVCDSFDAMTSERPYKRAFSVDWSLDELRRCAGTQFDPVVVDAFVRRIERRRAEPPPYATGTPKDVADIGLAARHSVHRATGAHAAEPEPA